MNRIYKTGDRVWIYDCPCEPRFATIIKKLDGVNAYHVEFKEGREKIRLYTDSHIYKYPEDLHKMICDMHDDSHMISRYAHHYEEFEDDDNPNNPIGWVK